MAEIIIVQGRRLKVETGDEIEVEKRMCGKCEGEHTKIIVTRNGKEIASLGDYLTLYGEDEVFGGVIVDNGGNVLPDPHWMIHIVPNDVTKGLTADKMYYVGMCGFIFDHEHKEDRITFPSDMRFIEAKNKDRICPKCLETHLSTKKGVTCG